MMQPSFNGLLTARVVFYFTSPPLVLDCCFNEMLSLAIPCSTQQLLWRLIRSLVGKMVCLYACTLSNLVVKNGGFESLTAGMKKSYWITCNNDMEMQNVLVDRRTLPSHLVVKPKDLSRLLTHFQSSLHEITLIATEPVTTPIDDETEAKAIELKSYIDPARGVTKAVHNQFS